MKLTRGTQRARRQSVGNGKRLRLHLIASQTDRVCSQRSLHRTLSVLDAERRAAARVRGAGLRVKLGRAITGRATAAVHDPKVRATRVENNEEVLRRCTNGHLSVVGAARGGIWSAGGLGGAMRATLREAARSKWSYNNGHDTSMRRTLESSDWPTNK